MWFRSRFASRRALAVRGLRALSRHHAPKGMLMRSSRTVALAGSLVTAFTLIIAPTARADSGPENVAYDTVAPQVSELTTALLRATKASGSPMQLTVSTRVWTPDNAAAKPSTLRRTRAYFDPSGSAMWWHVSPQGQVRHVGACDPQLGRADGYRYDCSFLYDTPTGKKKQLSSRELYRRPFSWINVHAYELATNLGHLAAQLIPPQAAGSSQTIVKTAQGKVTTFTIVRDDRPYTRRQTVTFVFTPTSVSRTITSTNYTLAPGPIDFTTGQPDTAITSEHLAFRTVQTLAVTQKRPMTYPPASKALNPSKYAHPAPTTLEGW